MHNKSFTADNQATIIGGRNVGDEYFDAGQGVSFVDLDVLAIGPVVNDVSEDFDRYWASDSSYPAERVLSRVSQTAVSEVTAAASQVEEDPAAVAYMQAIASLQYVQQVLSGQLPFEWATVQMVSDDPAKGLGRAGDNELLWTRLKQILEAPRLELELVSPYFVPGKEGVEYFSDLARRGIKVTILTNSLAATDVAAVHAGYARRRKPMLEAGVAIFEMRPEFSPPAREDVFDRPLTRLCRLVQLRSAIRTAQHRTRLRDRQSDHGARDCRCVCHHPSRAGL